MSTEDELAEVPAEELRRRLVAVLARHEPADGSDGYVCNACLNVKGEPTPWPCRTYLTLRGESR